MQVTALSSWFGSNRMLAKNVAELLADCDWVGVPFAGGMSELAHLDARTMMVSDLHRHVINLAKVVADARLKDELVARLDGLAFHPDTLEEAQARCRTREASGPAMVGFRPDLLWAEDFFVCCWMARNGTAGTDREFDAGISLRWEAQGGDSAIRFRNATKGLHDWHKIFLRCTFVCLDVFEFLKEVKKRDVPKLKNGVYLDAPWPDDGDKYKFKFDEGKQRLMAERLSELVHVRVVIRYNDHPLVRELYPKEHGWRWLNLTGRTAANKLKREVLIINPAVVLSERAAQLVEGAEADEEEMAVTAAGEE